MYVQAKNRLKVHWVKTFIWMRFNGHKRHMMVITKT